MQSDKIRRSIRINARMQEKSSVLELPSTRKCIIVFDIDNTLCQTLSGNIAADYFRKNHPECPIIEYNEPSRFFSNTSYSHPHVFLPHLQILFDYLMKQGARIVFFSSAPVRRNISVIPELLTSFWGSEKYEFLKSAGQFAIFSKNDMRKSIDSEEGGNYTKDLSVVLRDGELILDTILLDDDPSYCAHDQRPVMKIIDLMNWYYFGDGDETKDVERSHLNFYKNGTYYMLGLFKTYFEDEKYNQLPIREGIAQIVQAETDEYY